MKPLLLTRSLELVCQVAAEPGLRHPPWREGVVRTQDSYLRNAAFMFEPWIIVWQSVQGVSSDEPAFTPCTVPAATGLWH